MNKQYKIGYTFGTIVAKKQKVFILKNSGETLLISYLESQAGTNNNEMEIFILSICRHF